MTGLRFITQAPLIEVDPNRSDVACFVGFVGRQQTHVPRAVDRWLRDRGWTSGPTARSGAQPVEVPPSEDQPTPRTEPRTLLDVPVPIESWSVFEQLFVSERLIKAGSTLAGSTYLGAAVRSFFAQGGRRCYVVRVGDPWPITTERTERLEQISRLIPGYDTGLLEGTPSDRTSWHGVAHLLGLDDVSFLCLPDLCDAIADDPVALPPPPTPKRTFEQFTACSAPQAASPPDSWAQTIPAPQSGAVGYRAWAKALNLIVNFLEAQRSQTSLRPVQLVAAIPLPQAESAAAANLLEFLENSEDLAALTTLPANKSEAGLVSRVLQLVYPWVRTPGAVALPGQLESPDGVLVGLLARNALVQGTYRSAATLPLGEVSELVPELSRSQHYKPSYQEKSLIERVSLFGPTPSGLQLLSDVTTSLDESVRPASVHRLIGIILRAASRLGEALVFEASGERLWSQLEESLRGLMEGLYVAGAFRGKSSGEAFFVRCDRTTMTQNDLDNGRVIARIEFSPALPIERITVTLTLNDTAQSTLLPAVVTTREAA